MTVVIGKRKRREQVKDKRYSQEAEARSTYDSRLQALLRQNFEDRFEPLESCGPVSSQNTFLSSDDPAFEIDPTEWSGFSDEDREKTDAVVVDYQNTGKTRMDFSKEDLKVFMV